MQQFHETSKYWKEAKKTDEKIMMNRQYMLASSDLLKPMLCKFSASLGVLL